jgi:hypothetical protein
VEDTRTRRGCSRGARVALATDRQDQVFAPAV